MTRRPVRGIANSTVVWLLAALLGAATFTGCRNAPQPDEEAAQRVPAYPAEAPFGPPLDVVVVREGDAIRLVNRTPRRYEGVQLWLNRTYVRDVEAVEIGTDNRLGLTSFTNRFGEAYPVGSFLRPDFSEKLVLAELYDPAGNVRHKLVVQPPGTR